MFFFPPSLCSLFKSSYSLNIPFKDKQPYIGLAWVVKSSEQVIVTGSVEESPLPKESAIDRVMPLASGPSQYGFGQLKPTT